MGVVGVPESPQRPVPVEGAVCRVFFDLTAVPWKFLMNEWKGVHGGYRMSKEMKGWDEEGEQTCAHVSTVCESVLVQSEW